LCRDRGRAGRAADLRVPPAAVLARGPGRGRPGRAGPVGRGAPPAGGRGGTARAGGGGGDRGGVGGRRGGGGGATGGRGGGGARGAARAEMAAGAGDEAGCGQVEELVIEVPLELPPRGGVQVQVTAGPPDQDGRRELAVYGRPADAGPDGPWTRHAAGTL